MKCLQLKHILLFMVPLLFLASPFPPAAESEEKKSKEDEEMVEVVFVVDGSEVQAKQVKLGISDDTHYAVLTGLNDEDQVVTGPFKAINKTLNTGDKIKLKEGEQNAD